MTHKVKDTKGKSSTGLDKVKHAFKALGTVRKIEKIKFSVECTQSGVTSYTEAKPNFKEVYVRSPRHSIII